VNAAELAVLSGFGQKNGFGPLGVNEAMDSILKENEKS